MELPRTIFEMHDPKFGGLTPEELLSIADGLAARYEDEFNNGQPYLAEDDSVMETHFRRIAEQASTLAVEQTTLIIPVAEEFRIAA